ncbi:hypothetical protein [Sinanaerobacter chloroacetimidivorans]|uniref:Uncharacterized protein n=1 Tax=Sinanaerobacter chloroacetimidivorans TaxID=2818044 RepID=A0A8J7VX04_9FIRM|nr:hypothetical protein [Sinanaerobacter chloroacetimidivorans]MBR0596594.1 hypothetical protein [Sinanaerobacter chloroacetimidivorans]
MAIVLVNKDGTSNAKVGDYVVTGGGVYQKTATGSIRAMGLDTPTGSSKDYNDVVSKFASLVSGSGSSGNEKTTSNETVKINSVDDNGIVTVAGYDPTDYSTAYKTTSSSSGISNILGYVILGLVGIALLDRFMNGKG